MKNKLNYFVLTIMILSVLSLMSKSAVDERYFRFSGVDSLLSKQSELQSNTGIAVAIIQNTSILYNKGFGYKNLSTFEKVTHETMFHLGSVPKSFVAIALMQLVEQNLVDLDSPVIKYIPELKFTDERYKKITVRNLATHSSGIFTNRNHDWDNPKYERDALDKFVRSLNYDKLRFNPGEKFSYSDTNYDIIGDIIYRVTGLPFEDYMKKYVLEPSGMARSTFYLPDIDLVASPYNDNYIDCDVSRGILFPVNREHAPSGTLFSNTTEMCNWMMMNIHEGNFENNTLIKASTHKSLLTPAFETKWGSNYYESMATGWFVGKYNGKTTYLHSGTDYGYRAIFCIIPEDKYGVVILSNYKETPIHYLLDRILSEIYGKYIIDARSNLIQKEEYDEITGNYYDKSKNIAQITRRDNLLYFTYENETCCLSSIREGNIIAGQYKEGLYLPFYYDRANVFLSKIIDENGKGKYTVKLNGLVFEKAL